MDYAEHKKHEDNSVATTSSLFEIAFKRTTPVSNLAIGVFLTFKLHRINS